MYVLTYRTYGEATNDFLNPDHAHYSTRVVSCASLDEECVKPARAATSALPDPARDLY
jgi:hypothetical protein